MQPRRILFLGLSLTSSWGNGHATNYRALLRALRARGHDPLFLERDRPWYADHRDLPNPDFAVTALYDSIDELRERYTPLAREADAIVVGSYLPDGVEVIDWAIETARAPVVFYDIDTPVTLDALDRSCCAFLHPRQIPRFHAYLSFSSGLALRLLHERYGARRPIPFHCMIDPDEHAPLERAQHELDLGFLGAYSDDRQPALERLLLQPARNRPDLRFAVAGSRYPADIDWPGNVRRVDHVPPRAHNGFYCSQRFTLNVTRREMVRLGDSPSVRLFEAAACAVPVISDRWAGIDRYFTPGEEILLADGPEDVARILEDTPDDVRREIGRAARRRVLRLHTGERRAERLEHVLFGSRSSRRRARSGVRSCA